MEFYSIYNRETAGALALKRGETQVGLPYQWGGTTPGVGFDCSGLTQWMYATVGIALPRTTETQFKVCQLAHGTPLLPGDLLFIAGSDGTPTSPGHVMVYVSPGKVLQAPFTGEDINVGPYDTSVYDFITRPADTYGKVIKAPTAKDLKENNLVRLTTPAEETLALRNGYAVRGFNGKTFPVLPLNGVAVGVVKYAVVGYNKKKK